MSTKNTIITIVGIAVLAGLGFLAFKSNPKNSGTTDNIVTKEGSLENDMIPGKPEEKPNNFPTFGTAIAFKVNDGITFSDGLTVSLKSIGDSRCKPGHECFWEGELNPILEVSGGAISGTEEIHLGTVKNRSVAKGGYLFNLLSATEKSATVEVRKY